MNIIAIHFPSMSEENYLQNVLVIKIPTKERHELDGLLFKQSNIDPWPKFRLSAHLLPLVNLAGVGTPDPPLTGAELEEKLLGYEAH